MGQQRKLRTLTDGRAVAVHHNDGLRKRCACPRRAWTACPHPWHFSFKLKGGAHHRFPIGTYADHPIRSRADALAERDRLRLLIRDGHFPPAVVAPATPADLTFEAFSTLWRERARSQQSDNQKANDRGIVERLCRVELVPGERLAQRPIGLFTVDDWEAVFATVDKLAASSFNKYRQAVMAMQEWAVEKAYLPRPWMTGKVIRKGGALARRKGARRDRRLVADVLDDKGKVTEPGEERRLMAHVSPWLQRLVIAALESGMRRGELLSLRWQHVSLARGLITLRAENTKTRTMRQVPISPRLAAVLQMVRHDPDGHDLPATAHVFGDPIGGQMRFQKKAWGKSCKATGIVDLQFRDLRHEAGSRMMDKGWPLHHIQRMLGHTDAKTTSIYLNVDIQGLQDSMRRFGSGSQPLHDVAQGAESEPPPTGNDAETATAKALVN